MWSMSPLTFSALEEEFFPDGASSTLRRVGLATALVGAVGAVTLGLYVGRELRFRYRFRRRTPSDFFSNAGDPIGPAEYGMGI